MILRKQKLFAYRNYTSGSKSRRLQGDFSTWVMKQNTQHQQTIFWGNKRQWVRKRKSVLLSRSCMTLVLPLSADTWWTEAVVFWNFRLNKFHHPKDIFQLFWNVAKPLNPRGLSLQPPGMQFTWELTQPPPLDGLTWIVLLLQQSVTHRQLASSCPGHGGHALRDQTDEKSTLPMCF